MPPGVVHFRNCTCANRSRALACGAAGLRVSGWSVLRTVPEAFTPGPRFWGCGRGSALCGAGECCKEASHALRRSCCTRAVKCSLRGRGVSHVESLHGEQGCVRGRRARRLERRALLFPFGCACRRLASGCVLAKGKAGSGGGEKRQPEDRAAFGLSSRAGAAISFRASGRRCRVQGRGTVRIPPANSPASSRRACRSSPTSSVR